MSASSAQAGGITLGARIRGICSTGLVLTVLLGIAALAAWQELPSLLGIPSYIIPTFRECLAELGTLYRDDDLVHHVLATLRIASLGFLIGSVFGACGGYVLGLMPAVQRVLAPYLLMVQVAPKVALAPLFTMWLGYNDMPKLLVTVLVVFFPILVNVMEAMHTVDRDLVSLARAYDMTRLQVFWKIRFPSSLPSLMAGLKIGATLSIIGVTVGEMVGGDTGLGYLITFGQGQADTAMVFDAIILLSFIGILMYVLVERIEGYLLRHIPADDHS